MLLLLSSQCLAFDRSSHEDIRVFGEFSMRSVNESISGEDTISSRSVIHGYKYKNIASHIAIPKPNLRRAFRQVVKKPTATYTGVFGTKAIAFSPIASKKHWDRVRHSSFSLDQNQCRTSNNCVDVVRKFKTSLEKGNNLKFYDKLSLVNKIVNTQITYDEDAVTYRKTDYWASAQETIEHGWGDCEDYAILKYKLLSKMGVPTKSMSLVVLKDTSRDLYHAVLAISTSKGNFILDNVRDIVYRDTQIDHYQPIYSFSDNRSWIHGKPVKKDATKHLLVAHNFKKIAPGKSSVQGEDLFTLPDDFTADIRPQSL